MPLELTLRTASALPIEVEGLLPAAVRDKSTAEIERLPLQHGNERVPLAELFAVRGTAADDTLVFAGDTGGIHYIGAKLAAGQIRVTGAAGRHAGAEMTGGELAIDGDAGDWLGAELHGGLIRVGGRAGNQLGAAYRGSVHGMTGGAILVGGDAGDEVAHSMLRGVIAVGGSVGDFAAINMAAGSLFVAGSCGARPAAGMRRGTLAVFGPRPKLLPTFRSAGKCTPLFVQVYLRQLAGLGWVAAEKITDTSFELFHGDMVAVGRGEILLAV